MVFARHVIPGGPSVVAIADKPIGTLYPDVIESLGFRVRSPFYLQLLFSLIHILFHCFLL